MRSDRTNGGHWFLSGLLVVQYRNKHSGEKSRWCSTAVEKATKPIASLASMIDDEKVGVLSVKVKAVAMHSGEKPLHQSQLGLALLMFF